MDIHACRFVHYKPSEINTLAFSHTSILKKHGSRLVRLAIGRANGNLEIWRPLALDRWVHEIIIRGGKNRSIDNLIWVTDLDEPYGDSKTDIIIGRSRLFSTGYTNTITEWDLEKRVAKCHASGQHGSIWCLALQPFTPTVFSARPSARTTTESRILVAGTEDGAVVAYLIEDDSLEFDRIIMKAPKKKIKCISMTFQDRHTLIVGQTDGVSIIDLRTTTRTRKIYLQKSAQSVRSHIPLPWAVARIPNERNDIVVGDSTGHLTIIHGIRYTVSQRIEGHKQDLLCLAVNSDGTRISSGGMDRRVVVYNQVLGTGAFQKSFHSRVHRHDVKTMAAWQDIFVSGGLDTVPIVHHFAMTGLDPHRGLSHIPQDVPVAVAPKARLLVSWWDEQLQIWRIPRTVADNVLVQPDSRHLAASNTNYQLLCVMRFESDELYNSSVTISSDGSLLIVANILELRAYKLEQTVNKNGRDVIVPLALPLRPSWKEGCTLVRLSPNNRWLFMLRNGTEPFVADLDLNPTQHPDKTGLYKLDRFPRDIPKQKRIGGFGEYERTINCVDFSADSAMLAVADLSGYVDTWIFSENSNISNGSSHAPPNGVEKPSSLSDERDERDESDESDNDEAPLNGLPWKLNPKGLLIPKHSATITALSFSASNYTCPTDLPALTENEPNVNGSSHGKGTKSTDQKRNNPTGNILLTVTATGHISSFYPRSGKLTAWSRQHSFSHMPLMFTKNRDIAKGVVWQGSKAWIWGTTFIFMFDLDKKLPLAPQLTGTAAAETEAQPGQARGKKRKRAEKLQEQLIKHRAFIPLASTSVKKSLNGKNTKEIANITTKFKKVNDDDDDEGDEEHMYLDEEKDQEADDMVMEVAGASTTRRMNGLHKGNKSSSPGMAFWGTRQYRSVLGMAAMSTSAGVVEVVILERPFIAIDMAPRFYADTEWERR